MHTRLRLVLLALTHLHLGACASGRSASEAIEASQGKTARYLAAAEAEALHRVVPQAGAEMELEVVRRPSRVGEAWVMHRSPRLFDTALWWVVVVKPNPAGGSLLEVYGISEYRLAESTWETRTKDSELAYRIITLAFEGISR